MSQPLTQFTHEGIPPLPEGPQHSQAPVSTPQIAQGTPRPTHGIPQFEVVAKRRADGSFANVEYVTILTPGDPKAMPRHKVTDRIREKYAPYYDLWRRGLEVSPQGTPLEMFPMLTPAQVQAMKAINIFTVEQLADVADSNLHRIPMGQTIKRNAQLWLKSKRETDAIEAQVRENETLREGQRLLEQQIADLSKRLASTEQQTEQQTDQQTGQQASAPKSESMADALDKAIEAKDQKRGPGRPKKEG